MLNKTKNYPFFLIVIPTYKRKALLLETLHSVQKQTWNHFRIIISDSGNTLQLSELLAVFPEFQDRITLLNYGKEIPAHEHWESLLPVIEQHEFDYFTLLGDDDVWLPDCLDKIAKNAGPDVLACGVANFFQKEQLLTWSQKDTTQEFIDLDFKSLLVSSLDKHGCDLFENEKRCVATIQCPNIETHVSGFFISAAILRRTLSSYGSLWVYPFGDVGIGLAIHEAGYVRLMLSPLVIIRRHDSGGMAFVEKNRMHLADSHKFTFTDQFPTVVCFSVFAALSYEGMLVKLNRKFLICPRSWFYVVSMRQIANDGFSLKTTWLDLSRTLKHSVLNLYPWQTLVFDFTKYVRRRSQGKHRHIVQTNGVASTRLAVEILGLKIAYHDR